MIVGCPSGWLELVAGKCYKNGNEAVDYATAVDRCNAVCILGY